MLRRALAVASAALVLVACSGDDDDPVEDAATEIVDASASTTSTTIDYGFEGDPASPFCTLERDLAVQEVLNGESRTPAEVEAAYTTLLGILTEAAEVAPEELREDIGLVLAGVAALDDALRAVGYSYDELGASPNAAEVSAAVNDPAFGVAGARIEGYKREVCGL